MDATVITNDGVLFHIDNNFIDKCKTLANAFEDSGRIYALPLPNLDSQIMKRILKYHETGDIGDKDNMAPLLTASDYLAYEDLLDVGCKVVADRLRGKSANEIKKFFGMT